MATETDEIHLNTVKVGAKGGGCVWKEIHNGIKLNLKSHLNYMFACFCKGQTISKATYGLLNSP